METAKDEAPVEQHKCTYACPVHDKNSGCIIDKPDPIKDCSGCVVSQVVEPVAALMANLGEVQIPLSSAFQVSKIMDVVLGAIDRYNRWQIATNPRVKKNLIEIKSARAKLKQFMENKPKYRV